MEDMRQHDDKWSNGSVDADVFEETEPDEDDGAGGELSVKTSDKITTRAIFFGHVHQVQDRTNEQQQETDLVGREGEGKRERVGEGGREGKEERMGRHYGPELRKTQNK